QGQGAGRPLLDPSSDRGAGPPAPPDATLSLKRVADTKRGASGAPFRCGLSGPAQRGLKSGLEKEALLPASSLIAIPTLTTPRLILRGRLNLTSPLPAGRLRTAWNLRLPCRPLTTTETGSPDLVERLRINFRLLIRTELSRESTRRSASGAGA